MKSGFRSFLLFFLLAVPALLYVYLRVFGENHYTLPKYFARDVNEAGDSIYHTVPDFSFTDQNGETVTDSDVSGKIRVADYFFTTCQTICPIMKSQMNRVYRSFKDSTDLIFLSHTVDPETDSVEVLKEYAHRFEADPAKWKFLTGDKKALYKQARDGYYITATEGDGGEEDFIHSEKFVLVDKENIVRGYYDGTDSIDVDRLITELKVLYSEYKK